MNDKRVKDYDAFYNSPGDPNRKQMQESNHFGVIPGYDWVRITKDNDGVVRTRQSIPWVVNDSRDTVRYHYVLNKYNVRHLKVKVYDRTGKLIGYAKTDGNREYSLYDLNDKKLQTTDKLYSPPGTPLKSYMSQLYYQISR